ncbi:MAG: DNA repair protein RecN [Pseudomonadota bacterium]|nr:DNA repair protein RecN [Pseudomonadota bacterium]
MLNHLTVNDFVLFERAELSIKTGFTVLTGETGAGKSMLIDALGLILGGRADTSLVRAGASRADITAEFDITGNKAVQHWLESETLLGEESSCLIRRILDSEGRSRAWINGFPVTLQQLKDLGEQLIDIHGQHAHQKLLNPTTQRNLLDDFAQASRLALDVAEAYHAWKRALDDLARATETQNELRQKINTLDQQIQELKALALAKGEFFELQNEHGMLSHAAELIEMANAGETLLQEHEMAILPQLHQFRQNLADMIRIDPTLETLLQILDSAESNLKEMGHDLRQYASKIEIDETRLADLDDRLSQILLLARRYQVDPDTLPDLLEDWCHERELFDARSNLDTLRTQLETSEKTYMALANELTLKRQQAARHLSTLITQSMQELAMAGGRLDIRLSAYDTPGPSGLEQVTFEIASREEVSTRPLSKIASGGELSRISLAIAVAASQSAMVPTLVFDEVDVGIGGRVAEMVGRLMHTLGQTHQVLTVTHLPQVAARGNHHYRVEKYEHGNTFSAQLNELDAQTRIEEIARMLGGIHITDTTRRHAREMLAAG